MKFTSQDLEGRSVGGWKILYKALNFLYSMTIEKLDNNEVYFQDWSSDQ